MGLLTERGLSLPYQILHERNVKLVQDPQLWPVMPQSESCGCPRIENNSIKRKTTSLRERTKTVGTQT